jgi:hypothetical protein
LGQTRSGPFPTQHWRGSLSHAPAARPARSGLHAPLRRSAKPPTPMVGVSRHTREDALPVAWPPACFGGRVGCGPAPYVGTGPHLSMVAAIHCGYPERHKGCGHSCMSAKRDRTRSPARTPPNRKCAPAAAPRREEGQRSTTGGDWRESTGLVAPGTRSGLAGVVATRLRGVKTHQPFFKRRSDQRRLRIRPEKNQIQTKNPEPSTPHRTPYPQTQIRPEPRPRPA